MHAFFGNPPFIGGGKISGLFGSEYKDWLQTIHPGSHGNADYCAHFFRRAHDLLGPKGTYGFVATNTISQGDTRETGLRYLVTEGGDQIYDATPHMAWPGTAAVIVSMVHLAKGFTVQPCRLR